MIMIIVAPLDFPSPSTPGRPAANLPLSDTLGSHGRRAGRRRPVTTAGRSEATVRPRSITETTPATVRYTAHASASKITLQ